MYLRNYWRHLVAKVRAQEAQQRVADPRAPPAALQAGKSPSTRLEDVEVGVEGRHDVAVVRLEPDARQAGHGAGRLRLGEEAWREAGLGVRPEV